MKFEFDCLKTVSMSQDEVEMRIFGRLRTAHKKQQRRKTVKEKAITWRGYKKYISSVHWQNRRNKLIKKFKYCFVCGCDDDLTVHHKNYSRLSIELEKDLVVLCWGCHQEVHNLALNDKTIKLRDAHNIYKSLKYYEMEDVSAMVE